MAFWKILALNSFSNLTLKGDGLALACRGIETIVLALLPKGDQPKIASAEKNDSRLWSGAVELREKKTASTSESSKERSVAKCIFCHGTTLLFPSQCIDFVSISFFKQALKRFACSACGQSDLLKAIYFLLQLPFISSLSFAFFLFLLYLSPQFF